MASCYVCGANVAPNEGYRRKVNTGDSFGLSFGKRITPSARTYYGVRTLCANCATRHDQWENAKGILWLVGIGFFILLYLFGGLLDNKAASTSNPDAAHLEGIEGSAEKRLEGMPAREIQPKSQTQSMDETASTMMVNAPQELNVRSGPGTSFGVITTIHARDIVTVQRTEDGWSYIGYGWVSSKYLVRPHN